MNGFNPVVTDVHACSVIVWVRVVLKRTLLFDSIGQAWLDNLSRGYLQSQTTFAQVLQPMPS